MGMAERELLVRRAKLASGALVAEKECPDRGADHGQDGHQRGDQRCGDRVATGAPLAIGQESQFGLPELSQLLLDHGCQLPGPGRSQNCQGFVRARGAELNDLPEFAQPRFNTGTQLVQALALRRIVGDCRSNRRQQSWNVGLRTVVTVAIRVLSCQQIAALPRFGFEDASFEGRNSAQDLIRVFDPAEAFPLPAQVDRQSDCRNDEHRHRKRKRTRCKVRQDPLGPCQPDRSGCRIARRHAVHRANQCNCLHATEAHCPTAERRSNSLLETP